MSNPNPEEKPETTTTETPETQETTSEPVSEQPTAADAPAAVEAPTAEAEPTNEVAATDGGEVEEEESFGEQQSFEELLEQYDQFREYRPGEVVIGTVVNIGEQEIVLDIGARVEGIVPTSEFTDAEGKPTISDGDKIEVMVLRFNPEGQHIPLSFERARVAKVWDVIETAANEEQLLEGTIIEKVKGGFIVDVGVRAFLPTSQATLKPQKDYQDLLGQKGQFRILKIQRRRGNLILSRKELLVAEFEESRKGLMEKLQEGSVLDGKVKNITDYGAFIDLGGLDGLLHISDMSWGRINHPKDILEVAQDLKVKVLRYDPEKEKVSLGLKQITPDPWLSVAEKYPPGKSVKGHVLNLTSYGAFVELEAGVEGMIHVSELSWTKKVRNPSQLLSKGQELNVRVLDLDTEKRRVSLSLKQNEDNPWDSLAERFPVGSKVKGKVRNITEFGAFVEIDEGIDGLVHISDFAWGERNANPEEFVKKGEEIEVVILAIDVDNKKVSLGRKQMQHDPWIDFTNEHKENEIMEGPITKVTDFGVFIHLADHVEGLIRANELDKDRTKKPSELYKEGQTLRAMIIRINHRERKVDLSVRRIEQIQERQAIREYAKSNESSGATMGDIFSDQLRDLIK